MHAWSKSRMCLHHAHFVPCTSVERLLRRVPRASIAHTTKGKKQPRKTLRRKIFCPPRSPIDESSRKPKNATAHAAINRTLLQHEKSYAYYRLSTGSYAHYRHPTGSKQNRIAVCAPTKCPRATDNNTNRFNRIGRASSSTRVGFRTWRIATSSRRSAR